MDKLLIFFILIELHKINKYMENPNNRYSSDMFIKANQQSRIANNLKTWVKYPPANPVKQLKVKFMNVLLKNH